MKEVLRILAERISRKAILISMAMILIYMIAITPSAVFIIFTICAICGLTILGVLLQFYIDKKKLEK